MCQGDFPVFCFNPGTTQYEEKTAKNLEVQGCFSCADPPDHSMASLERRFNKEVALMPEISEQITKHSPQDAAGVKGPFNLGPVNTTKDRGETRQNVPGLSQNTLHRDL